MAHKSVTIQSLTEYTKYLERRWGEDDLLFRGQRMDDPLLPKIARIQLHDDVAVVEKRMLEDFKRRALPYLEFQPESNWDWLALAQHHGLATRLLDWTANPIAALWFAIQNPAENGKYGIVWVFHTRPKRDYVRAPESMDPFNCTKTLVFQPRHVTRRIIVQAGWFTVHKYHEEQKRFIALERNVLYSSRLHKIRIPAYSFADIRWELDRWGFNFASLFPDLDGLCRHLQWQHSILEDESESLKTTTARVRSNPTVVRGTRKSGARPSP